MRRSINWPLLALGVLMIVGFVGNVLTRSPARECYITDFGNVLETEPKLYKQGRDPTIDAVNGSWRTATDFKLCYLKEPKK